MNVQWYPGHMTRAFARFKSDLKLVDAVVEVVDARIPLSGRNPLFDRILEGKDRLIALNKCDLSDHTVNIEWLKYLKGLGLDAVLTDSVNGAGIDELRKLLIKIAQSRMQNKISRGRLQRPPRVMVAGIPNTGKSSLINRITGRASAVAGAKPGLTKGPQWIKMPHGLEMLDTPGVLWPRMDNENTAKRLALVGSFSDDKFDAVELAQCLIGMVYNRYPDEFNNRFKLNTSPEYLKRDDHTKTLQILEQAGSSRGCLLPANEIDINRISLIILREFREGKIGKISLETPGVLDA